MQPIVRFTLMCLLLVAGPVQARLEAIVTQWVDGTTPIAVVPFAASGGAVPEDVSAIVAADLRRSGRFSPVALEELPERPARSSQVSYPLWRGVGSDSLVVGQVQTRGDGSYQVTYQLLDIRSGDQLAGSQWVVKANQLRWIAHIIADEIYQTLTGEQGAFATHVAYISVLKGRDGKPVYRLAMAHSDGYNEQELLSSRRPLMSPVWSPDGNKLAYVSFEQGKPQVFVQEVFTSKREAVASFPGINSAPAWSPDGRRLALTLSKDGNTEIYILELASRRLHRITNNYAIDTEPAWAPDGRSLLFTSDRGGKPQIYQVAITGSEPTGRPRRLTFEGSYNARARFSPDGRKITLVHGVNGGYRVAVMDLASGNLLTLTDSTLDESPSFSPNGAMIIYATEVDWRGVLGVSSVDGRARQRLQMNQGDVREPAWSPIRAN